jgi:hypothetical protein
LRQIKNVQVVAFEFFKPPIQRRLSKDSCLFLWNKIINREKEMTEFNEQLNRASEIREFYILAKENGFEEGNPEVEGYKE